MENRKSVQEILKARRSRAYRIRNQRVDALYAAHPDLSRKRERKAELGRQLILEGMSAADEGKMEAIRQEMAALEEEERASLEKLGISDSFFQPEWTHPACQDTGFINGRACSCRKQLQVEEQYDMSSIRRMLEEQNFDHFDLSLFRQDRQPGEPFSPYENMRDLFQQFQEEYVPYFSSRSPNIYLYGPTGTGKTFLANCIAKGLLDEGHTVLYQTAPELIDFLVEYGFMYADQREKGREKKEFAQSCDLLVIDDLGTENHRSQPAKGALFSLINGRLINHRPTLISSNLDAEGLRSEYDQRIYSRILGNYRIFKLFGNDLRMENI